MTLVLGYLLFAVMQLPPIQHTQTGPNTSTSFLTSSSSFQGTLDRSMNILYDYGLLIEQRKLSRREKIAIALTRLLSYRE